MSVVIGIDLSTSATGLVALDCLSGSPVIVGERLAKLPNKLIKSSPYTKQNYMLSAFEEFRMGLSDDPLVSIEDYGINMRRPSSVIPLAEIGGVFRFYLNHNSMPYISPKPSQLKKFITLIGKGGKDPMKRAIANVWGYDNKDDNMVDAYALAILGLAYSGQIKKLSVEQFSVLALLKTYSRD